MGTLYQIDFLLVETFLDISCFILRELLAFSFWLLKNWPLGCCVGSVTQDTDIIIGDSAAEIFCYQWVVAPWSTPNIMYISPKRIWIINATGPGQVYIYICIGPETINSLAAEHNIMRIPNRQTVMTWELESSSTAATHRQHCTQENYGQPTFSRVHCQTSLCELWVFKYIHGEMPCSQLSLYRILYMVWFCIQYLTLHDTQRSCFHKGEVAGRCLL